jgi:TetR/AcrR family transcriptional regulator
MARPKAPAPDTRRRILVAASDEFGAHGFAAATVDRIARRARVNKAMIYYHFPNKRALYTCIIRDVFAPITDRVSEAMRELEPPARKLDRLIDALVRSIDESAHFLPIFLREIADGGAHLGPEELDLIAGIFAAVRGVIGEGADQKVFQPVHPALAHFTIVGPLVMFRASAPVRARLKAVRHVEVPEADSDTLVRHLQMVARRMLGAEGNGESKVESRESKVESRESGVESRESGVESRESGVESRESGVESRESRVESRESKVESRAESRAVKLKAES